MYKIITLDEKYMRATIGILYGILYHYIYCYTFIITTLYNVLICKTVNLKFQINNKECF